MHRIITIICPQKKRQYSPDEYAADWAADQERNQKANHDAGPECVWHGQLRGRQEVDCQYPVSMW